ncbi:MAG: prephenate dehydrogenase [Litorilinea sp.]
MDKRLKECRVAIIGMGLMGASLAMDLTHKKLCREVRGVARRTETVLDAFFSQAVDLATNDLRAGVNGADLVILATPVRTIVAMLEELGPYLWPGAVVMDMGSTKIEICAALDRLPPEIQPIGGHPMTGKETAGFHAAEPNLYNNATWVISPLARTRKSTVDLALELVCAVDANPVILEAARHDRLVAAVSHLPYVVASALVDTVAQLGAEDSAVWELAAGGFRDTSRVAASDTRMFLDILATNRAAVLEQIDTMQAHLHQVRALLAANDEAGLLTKLTQSQAARAPRKTRNTGSRPPDSKKE